MSYDSCPCCGASRYDSKQSDEHISLVVCSRCGALYGGRVYLGESYKIVKPFFAAEEIPVERQQYYDIETLGSKGLDRRHGWRDSETHYIVQVG